MAEKEKDIPCEVIRGRLTISSLAVAERVLPSGAYTCVVSIGCPTPSTAAASLSRLELPTPKDLPETLLLASLSQSTAYLRAQLTRDGDSHALVHCVYGQSRSAAVVLAYLISLCDRPDSSAEDILSRVLLQLRTARPVICINPGFLSQLYLAAMSGADPQGRGNGPAARLVRQTEWRAVYGMSPASPDTALVDVPGTGCLWCRACSSVLCSEMDVVTGRENRSICDFVKEHTDAFWAEYRPKYDVTLSKKKKKSGANDKGDPAPAPAPPSDAVSEDYLVCWQAWMVSQVVHSSCAELLCPNPRCGIPVGRYAALGMPLCGGFFSVDNIVLLSSAVLGHRR